MISQPTLDDQGKDLIQNYRAISVKLKKRFMKKPNVREAGEDYGKMANSLKNEENHGYAAMCFTAMARCDQLIGDSSGEAESWASAARQFLQAEDQLYQARNTSYQEMTEAAIQCFLLAIHVLESQGDNLLAGSFALEAGQRLMRGGHFSQAVVFLQRAVDLQHQTRECRLDTLREITTCYVHLREYSNALSTLSTMVLDMEDKLSRPFDKLLQECKESQLLLLLLLKPNKRHLNPKLLALLSRFTERPSLQDVTDKNLLLHSLVVSVNEKDYPATTEVVKRLRPLLNPVQRKILHVLYEEHSPHHSLH